MYHREKEVTWDPREAEEKKEPWYVILKSKELDSSPFIAYLPNIIY